MTAPGSKWELNGGWSILLKVCICTYPLVLLWAGWVSVETVNNRQFRLVGDRFTNLDAQKMEMRMQAELAREVKGLVLTISSLPPVDWRTRIEKLEEKIDTIEANQIKIIAILERQPPKP